MPPYSFQLPPEEQVLLRNRTITTYYAQLYQSEPLLFKWAGMAAFASFHIGEKLKLWDWEESGIKPFSFTCEKGSRSLEDDFQIIRIINNRIFEEIGWVHLAFSQLDFTSFRTLLVEADRHPLIINAFEQLNRTRQLLKENDQTYSIQDMIWEANTQILWHEQSEVVQPMFDRLSGLFSSAMSVFASFDYKINHRQTGWRARSRFLLFMVLKGFSVLRQHGYLPEVTQLEQRWFWISQDLLAKWKNVEADGPLISREIELLASMEDRKLSKRPS